VRPFSAEGATAGLDELLLERESELARLDAALDEACAGSGGIVVVEGPAGVGKSRLLLAARQGAAQRNLAVLSARGTELEQDLPFGVARQLFVPTLMRAPSVEREQLLAGPAAAATALLAASVAPQATGEGQAAMLVEALYWLAVNLAQPPVPGSRPAGLLLLVDDAQWSDRPSLRFLNHAVGDPAEAGICVLLAVRTGEPRSPQDLLTRMRAHPGRTLLRPRALSPGAVGELVRAGGFPLAEEAFCDACAQASGGNPLLVGELLDVVRSEGAAATAETAHRVGELVPDSVLSAVVANLGRLPAAAARLATAVAVLEEASAPLAAALAGLDVTDAEDAADALAEANLLVPGEPLRFLHPLLAAAVRADVPTLALARMHRRAAALLDEADAEAGRVAGHLVNTRPAGEEWASRALRTAGREALVHEESRVAVRLLRRALAEPPPAPERDATLVELAQAEAADDSVDAIARLAEVLERLPDGHQRASAYYELARLLFFKGEIAQSAQAAGRGLEEVAPDDTLVGHLVSAHLTAATFDSTLRSAVSERLAPYLAEARAGVVPADPLMCAHVCARMAVAGDPADLVRPVAEGAFTRHPLVDEAAHGVVLMYPIVALIAIDDLDRATEVLIAAAESRRARSSLITRTIAHHWTAVVGFHRGELVDARAHAQRALSALGIDDWDLYGPWIASNLAEICVERGDLDGARAALADKPLRSIDRVGHCRRLEAQGRIAMADGDPQLAYDAFTEAGRLLEGMGMVGPGFLAWRSSAASAAHLAGRPVVAGELAAAELALARRTGARRAVGVALRVSGLVDPGDRAIELLTESVTVLAGSAARLEFARSLVDLGAALRRRGERRAAREPLQQGLDIAAHAGADPIAQRAREELRAAGSRPRSGFRTGVEALTPTERRIAQLAVQDRTNPQIAHDLYVTTKTVEWHLANVFRKLDVSSRRQLPTLLGPRS
jgi:DNA-binding CsgD family transcriptional regulator